MKEKMNNYDKSRNNTQNNYQLDDIKTLVSQMQVNYQPQIDKIKKDFRVEIEKLEERVKVLEDIQQKYSSLDGRITALEKKLDPPKNEPDESLSKENWIKKLLKHNWFIVGVIIILIGFDIYIHIPIVDIKCSYFGAIMGFVGILATFIVVGNFAQVKDIEGKFNDKVDVLDKAQKKTEDFTKFLDQFQTGTVDYYQALTLHIESLNKKKHGLKVYKLFVTSLYHFIQCSGYKGIDNNIKTCLNAMKTSIEKASIKEIELANDSNFGWFVEEIRKSNIPEFTNELKQEFDNIELNRGEKEPTLTKFGT